MPHVASLPPTVPHGRATRAPARRNHPDAPRKKLEGSGSPAPRAAQCDGERIGTRAALVEAARRHQGREGRCGGIRIGSGKAQPAVEQRFAFDGAFRLRHQRSDFTSGLFDQGCPLQQGRRRLLGQGAGQHTREPRLAGRERQARASCREFDAGTPACLPPVERWIAGIGQAARYQPGHGQVVGQAARLAQCDPCRQRVAAHPRLRVAILVEPSHEGSPGGPVGEALQPLLAQLLGDRARRLLLAGRRRSRHPPAAAARSGRRRHPRRAPVPLANALPAGTDKARTPAAPDCPRRAARVGATAMAAIAFMNAWRTAAAGSTSLSAAAGAAQRSSSTRSNSGWRKDGSRMDTV